MANKETLQTYNNKLIKNNEDLQTVIDMINNLPEAGGNTALLQDKSIEITENGTTNIVADEGYDGLNNVNVVTNVPSVSVPNKGFIVNEWDENGYPTKIETVGMTSIPSNYFSGNNALTNKAEEIILSEEVTSLGTSVFFNTTGLKRVVIPSGVTKISGSTFSNCTSLQMKTVPDTVTYIDYEAFYNTYITQMSVKNADVYSVYTSYRGAFFNCSYLRALWLGSNFTGKGYYLYSYNNNFKRLFIDLPRATVEAMTGYARGFQSSSGQTANAQARIVCNDDEGFMTKEEFDAIDWATYSE